MRVFDRHRLVYAYVLCLFRMHMAYISAMHKRKFERVIRDMAAPYLEKKKKNA